MGNQENISVLVIEKNNTVAESIIRILKTRPYVVTLLYRKDEALSLIKESIHPLAIIGNTEGNESSFEVMKEIVMTSPMTSMILITDLPKKEVDDLAEGYGILGHINRKVPPEELISLLGKFEDIHHFLTPPGK